MTKKNTHTKGKKTTHAVTKKKRKHVWFDFIRHKSIEHMGNCKTHKYHQITQKQKDYKINLRKT